MTNKKVTIKKATDEELSKLLYRLRMEREAQDLIRSIRQRATPQYKRGLEDEAVSTEEPIESLYHYGILGMKWGIRRFQPYPKGQGHKGKFLGRKTKDQKKVEKQRAKPPSKKAIKDMTDQELKEVVDRLQMEKRYRDLTTAQKSQGQKLVADILNDAAKQAASAYVKKTLKEYANAETKKGK